MTALCGGGTSAPKAGWPAVFDPTITLIAELLAARGGKWVLGALGFQLIDPISLSTFCAGDPPALPTFTSDETNAILRLQFGADFDSGIAKLKDFIQHVIWREVCECTSGSITTYTAPAVPSGTPEYYPPPADAVVPCWTDAITTFTRSAGGGPTFSGFITHAGAYGLDVTLGVVTIEIIALTGNFNVVVEVRQQTVDASVTGHTYSFTRGVGTTSVNVTWDPLYPVWAVYTTGQAGTGNRDVNVSSKLYCGGQTPGGTVTPCCPPDVATQAALDLILKMVTLQQRQTAPFAYVYGTNHTGLTDDGELAVSGLLGVSVDVTTLPTSYGRAAGTPEHLFDIGYVTLGTVDGWLSSRRIDADGTLELAPNGAGALTKIGYSLKPGVVAAIRELVREP